MVHTSQFQIIPKIIHKRTTDSLKSISFNFDLRKSFLQIFAGHFPIWNLLLLVRTTIFKGNKWNKETIKLYPIALAEFQKSNYICNFKVQKLQRCLIWTLILLNLYFIIWHEWDWNALCFVLLTFEMGKWAANFCRNGFLKSKLNEMDFRVVRDPLRRQVNRLASIFFTIFLWNKK